MNVVGDGRCRRKGPLRKLDCSPKYGSAKNYKSKAIVRCRQRNPLRKVNESKIGYTVKLHYECRRKRSVSAEKVLCENLTAPQILMLLKSDLNQYLTLILIL